MFEPTFRGASFEGSPRLSPSGGRAGTLARPYTSLDRSFALAAGSVRGFEHSRLGRNNQDACAFDVGDERILAVVCDGCGSGRYSEVGAQLGARLLLAALRRRLADRPHERFSRVLERARRDVLRRFAWLTRQIGGPRVSAVRDYLLFTVVGAVVEPRETRVFALGDGVAAVNGELLRLHFKDNRPPYLGYGLIPRALADPALGCQGFSVLTRLATADLDSLMIATDGLDELPADRLEAFWKDDLMFKNPHAVQRRLARLGRPLGMRHKQARRLADDTTVIVLRRRPK